MGDDDIIKDFLVEGAENLDRLDRDLVGLEKIPDDKNALSRVASYDHHSRRQNSPTRTAH